MIVNFLAEALHDEQLVSAIPHSRIALDRVAVIILSGGEGTRLQPLTHDRCKPAISFGGRYSLIDVPISHSLSTGLNKIFIIGQYLTYSLQKHLFQTYFYHGISQNQIQLLVPEEEKDGKGVWYEGTADAIRKNLHHFSEVPADYFLILSGDQLYNINFQEMINLGIEVDAGLLVAAQPVGKKEASRMGLLKIEPNGSRIVDFLEKPQDEILLKQFYIDDTSLQHLGYTGGQKERHYLGSMGIYLFKRQTLFDLLHEDSREDFAKHLIPTQMKKQNVHTYVYDGYWEDIGTIDSYYHANLALTETHENPKRGLMCYDERQMIFTKPYNLPGVKISDCQLKNSIVCEGAIIEAQEITHSVIGVRTVIGKGTILRDTITLGNEYYERPPLAAGETSHRPEIGKNCFISKAIIDENVIISDNVQLINKHGHLNFDTTDGFVVVRDGIMVIPRGTHIPPNYVF